MRRGIDKSKIIYDKKRKLADSAATDRGYLLIGIKDNPSKEAIDATIRHEFAHTQIRGKRKLFKEQTHHERSLTELAVYRYEKRLASPSEWNEILPTRIKDFIPYITWETKKEQQETRRLANAILAPKKGGGNLVAIGKSSKKLSDMWLEKPAVHKPRISARRTILPSTKTPRITPRVGRLR